MKRETSLLHLQSRTSDTQRRMSLSLPLLARIAPAPAITRHSCQFCLFYCARLDKCAHESERDGLFLSQMGFAVFIRMFCRCLPLSLCFQLIRVKHSQLVYEFSVSIQSDRYHLVGVARKPLSFSRVALVCGVPERIHLEKQGWCELLYRKSQPAHSTVLWILLGTRFCVRPR